MADIQEIDPSNVLLQGARTLGFNTKHYTTSYMDPPRAQAMWDGMSEAVAAFSADEQVPEELKVAAQQIDRNVQGATLADLSAGSANQNIGRVDGWSMYFIKLWERPEGRGRDESPKNYGILMAKGIKTETVYPEGPRHSWDGADDSFRRLGGVSYNAEDAFLWVDPNVRNRGIGSAALTIYGTPTNFRRSTPINRFRSPFELNMEDPAVAKIVEHFGLIVPVVPELVTR